MGLRLFGTERLRHLGWAMVGFALLFVGIDAMKEGMAQFRSILTPESLPEDTLVGRLQFIVLGIAITIVTQSSSAGVAASLVALGTGTITLSQAAVLVIGMDVGTTFSAALATVGGSAATRRTGYAHVFYNALTGVFAFAMLGPYLMLVEPYLAGDTVGNSQVALVAFHSLFNFLGVILILPFADNFSRLVMWLVPEQDPTIVRRLDHRLLAHPASAVDAVAATVRELSRHIARCAEELVSQRRSGRLLSARMDAIEQALETTHRFVDQIRSGVSDKEIYARNVAALHTLDHLDRVLHRCRQKPRIEALNSDHRLRRLSSVLRMVLAQISWNDLARTEERLNRVRVLMREQRRTYRQRCIESGIVNDVGAEEILRHLDSIRWLHRVSYHFWRIIHHVRIANQRADKNEAIKEARLDVADD